MAQRKLPFSAGQFVVIKVFINLSEHKRHLFIFTGHPPTHLSNVGLRREAYAGVNKKLFCLLKDNLTSSPSPSLVFSNSTKNNL